MLIERAGFSSQQAGAGLSFDFKPDRLNLFSTDEDQKKADLFSSISFVLWGAGENAAETAALREASIELEVNGKKLILKRDAQSNLLEIVSDEDLKITTVNDLFSGISKDLFNSFFLIGQDEGGSAKSVDRSSLISLLGQFAGLSEHSLNIEKAVKVVEDRLERYPFHGRAYRMDDLIGGLTRGKIVLEERLLQLERERKDAALHIAELGVLESELALARRTKKREEYFQLCLETAELDSRIMKVQQRLLYEAELKRELANLGDFSDFPIVALRKVQELWTMRQSRTSDLERLLEDIAGSQKETDIVEESLNKEAEGLEQFLIEDAQQLYGLGKIFATAQQELVQLRLDRTKEMRRLKDEGVDFDSISLVRKFILTMDPADLGEANKLSHDVKRQKDKLANLVALSENTSNQLKVISAETALFNAKARSVKDVLVLFFVAVSTIFIVISLTAAAGGEMVHLLRGFLFASCGLSALALVCLPRVHASMRSDFEAKVEGIVDQQNKFGAQELAMSDNVAVIQERGEKIAKKYKLVTSAELFKKLHLYDSYSARLKQLDVLDHLLSTREQQLSALQDDAMAYFDKISRKLVQVTPAAINGLASEILRSKEGSRELERSSAVLSHKLSERRFLEGEIQELDGVLKDLFKKAQLSNPEKLEESFAEFEKKSQDYAKWEKLTLELKSMEKNIGAELLEQDLATVLNRLQHKRTDAWNKMQDLISRYPDILTETIEDAEIGRLTGGEGKFFEEDLQKKQDRVDSLRYIIRSAARNFDEFHPKTQHELEILERDFDQIKHNRDALVLARDTLRQVAQESKSSWSQELAEISAEMLADAGLEIDKIEWNDNLEMSLTAKGQSEPIHEDSIAGKIPRGLIKQINWVTRLMICRYIARRLPLPVVLDEPFCDLDDKRFAGCMHLLVKKLLPHCQLIVLTCQQVRHRWFVDRLAAPDKDQIQFI
jgi:hypothetical protein